MGGDWYSAWTAPTPMARLLGYDFRDLTVLVAHDNDYIRELMRTILSALGVGRVRAAQSGQEALTLVDDRLQPPDVMMCSWWFRDMQGADLLLRLRQELLTSARFLPVVMIAGQARQADVIAARDAGANEFITVPIAPRTVYERLVEVVFNSRPFISATGYFGPDRRRYRDPDYDGPERRRTEPEAVEAEDAQSAARIERGVERDSGS